MVAGRSCFSRVHVSRVMFSRVIFTGHFTGSCLGLARIAGGQGRPAASAFLAYILFTYKGGRNRTGAARRTVDRPRFSKACAHMERCGRDRVGRRARPRITCAECPRTWPRARANGAAPPLRARAARARVGAGIGGVWRARVRWLQPTAWPCCQDCIDSSSLRQCCFQVLQAVFTSFILLPVSVASIRLAHPRQIFAWQAARLQAPLRINSKVQKSESAARAQRRSPKP